jgi:hypothetical protein
MNERAWNSSSTFFLSPLNVVTWDILRKHMTVLVLFHTPAATHTATTTYTIYLMGGPVRKASERRRAGQRSLACWAVGRLLRAWLLASRRNMEPLRMPPPSILQADGNGGGGISYSHHCYGRLRRRRRRHSRVKA